MWRDSKLNCQESSLRNTCVRFINICFYDIFEDNANFLLLYAGEAFVLVRKFKTFPYAAQPTVSFNNPLGNLPSHYNKSNRLIKLNHGCNSLLKTQFVSIDIRIIPHDTFVSAFLQIVISFAFKKFKHKSNLIKV